MLLALSFTGQPWALRGTEDLLSPPHTSTLSRQAFQNLLKVATFPLHLLHPQTQISKALYNVNKLFCGVHNVHGSNLGSPNSPPTHFLRQPSTILKPQENVWNML